jgi:hypothetical protein
VDAPRSGLPNGAHVHAVRVNASRPNEALAATSNGVYRTLDGGATWASWGLETFDVLTIAIDSTSELVFAGVDAEEGLFVRIDGA